MEVFEEVRTRIKAQGGVEHTLLRNFRSVPGVVHFVNAFFSRHIVKPEDGGTYQPDYDPIAPFRAEGEAPRVELLVHVPEDKDDENASKASEGRRQATGVSADEARELEARLLAARLERMIDRERLVSEGNRTRIVRPGDIALLFRATTHLDVYTSAFQDRNLPVRVVGSTRFYAAQEVVDLANVLRAVASPHDTIALVGALRSPAFGIDDVRITHLARYGLLDYRRADALDALVEAGVTVEGVDGLKRAYETLAHLHNLRDRVSMPALISEALDRTVLLPVAYASLNGEQKVLNLEKVRSLARSYEAAGMRSLERFAGTLLSAIAGKRQEEEMSDTEVGDDVIRILTIHKAKGLEWPVVVVPGLMSTPQGADTFLVRRRTAEFGFHAGGAQTSNWSSLKEDESPRLEAERMRLFYVAATRARDYLILSGVTQSRQRKTSFLSLLSNFMEGHAGPDWRKLEVASVEGDQEDPDVRRLHSARIRVADSGALLDVPPMSSYRTDLVTVVDRIGDPETTRRIPDVEASREVAKREAKTVREAVSHPRRFRILPPDSQARRAILETLAGGGPSPLAKRLAVVRLWGVQVPLVALVASGTVVVSSVDALFEKSRGETGALLVVTGEDEAASTWIDAVVTGLGSLPSPRPTHLEVFRVERGEGEGVDLTPARVAEARSRLLARLTSRSST